MAVIDTLDFAERFENVGFGHDQARELAAAFASTAEATRKDLVTTAYLDARIAQQEARMAEMETRLMRAIGDMEVRLTRQIGEVGNGLSNRLWSTIAISAGIATAISATIGAGIALLLHKGM